MPELTERHTFKTTTKQKATLQVMHSKYKLNVSQFIRDAVAEKLERERDTIFKQYKEIQCYLNKDCPF